MHDSIGRSWTGRVCFTNLNHNLNRRSQEHFRIARWSQLWKKTYRIDAILFYWDPGRMLIEFGVSDAQNDRIWTRTCLLNFESLEIVDVIDLSKLVVVKDYPAGSLILVCFGEEHAPGFVGHALSGMWQFLIDCWVPGGPISWIWICMSGAKSDRSVG